MMAPPANFRLRIGLLLDNYTQATTLKVTVVRETAVNAAIVIEAGLEFFGSA
jgi:hypothetical protein